MIYRVPPPRPENEALLSGIFWPVGPPFQGAAVWPNMLNLHKSAADDMSYAK